MNSKFANTIPCVVFENKKTKTQTTFLIKKTTTQQQTTPQPFCKVCHDAKQTGYNTHFVKDLDGNVTCPYLLSLNCSYCRNPGHTVKYCSVLETRKQNEKKERRTQTHTRPDGWTIKSRPGKFLIVGLDEDEYEKENTSHNKNNRFVALEQEEDEPKPSYAEFPQLVKEPQVQEQESEISYSSTITWAAVAIAPKPVAKMVKLQNVSVPVHAAPVPVPVPVPVHAAPVSIKQDKPFKQEPSSRKWWDDETSTEEDDE